MQINDWGLGLGLSTCVLRDNYLYSAEDAYREQSPYWSRFSALGAQISEFYLDSNLYNGIEEMGYTYEQCAEEVAQFIYYVRELYPDPQLMIYSFEPYPHFSYSTLTNWLVSVNLRCSELGCRGLDGYFMDPNWTLSNFNWSTVAQIEQFCSSHGFVFGYVFWAAEAAGYEFTAQDIDWYLQTMQQGSDLTAAGITPDRFIYMSWIAVPKEITPENEPYSFCYDALQFFGTYASRR